MARPEEKALRVTLLAAFVVVAVFAVTLYRRQPADQAMEQQQRDQDLLTAVQSTAPTLGEDEAPVTIAEFSDFQCPFCKNVSPLLARAEKEYPGKIRRVWIYVANPTQHPQSENAAVAAACAANQGRFWEYHDKLFELQDSLGPAAYNQIAQSLNLDMQAFQTCLSERSTLETVRSHTQFAQRAGVTATPYVTVNSTAFTSEFSWEQLKSAIDKALQ